MSTFFASYPPQDTGGVTSIDGMTGAITLVAGTGISIVDGVQTITISSTSAGDVTVGPFGSTPNSNGLSISGSQVLNLQPADATHPGGISVADWNTFNNKQSTLTLGNITSTPITNLVVTGGTGAIVGSGVLLTLTGASLVEATSAVLTITGATNAVLGTGVSIQVKQASTTLSGYLSSTDWNTFNSKQASGNYITALTGDATASGPGSAALTLATVNGNVGTFASVTVNAKGLVTAAAALSGDATTSSAVLTLATVNSNVGTFGSATAVPSLTVNGKGLITAVSAVTITTPNKSVANKTAAYTTVATDNTLTFDMSGSGNASYAVTLLTAVGNTGLTQTIYYSVGTGILSINTTSAQTIGGLASGVIKLGAVNDSVTVMSDGTNWRILNYAVSVSFRYFNTASTITSSDTTTTFSTKDFDAFGLYSSGTFTVTIPGKYQINSAIVTAATYALNGVAAITIYKNGSAVSLGADYSGGAEANLNTFVADTLQLVAGDAITIRSRSSGTGPTLASSTTANFISAIRLGW